MFSAFLHDLKTHLADFEFFLVPWRPSSVLSLFVGNALCAELIRAETNVYAQPARVHLTQGQLDAKEIKVLQSSH